MSGFFINKKEFLKLLNLETIFIFRNSSLIEIALKKEDFFDFIIANSLAPEDATLKHFNLRILNNLYQFNINIHNNNNLSNDHEDKYHMFETLEDFKAAKLVGDKNINKLNIYMNTPNHCNYDKCINLNICLRIIPEKILIRSDLFQSLNALKHFLSSEIMDIKSDGELSSDCFCKDIILDQDNFIYHNNGLDFILNFNLNKEGVKKTDIDLLNYDEELDTIKLKNDNIYSLENPLIKLYNNFDKKNKNEKKNEENSFVFF